MRHSWTEYEMRLWSFFVPLHNTNCWLTKRTQHLNKIWFVILFFLEVKKYLVFRAGPQKKEMIPLSFGWLWHSWTLTQLRGLLMTCSQQHNITKILVSSVLQILKDLSLHLYISLEKCGKEISDLVKFLMQRAPFRFPQPPLQQHRVCQALKTTIRCGLFHQGIVLQKARQEIIPSRKFLIKGNKRWGWILQKC